MIKFVQCFTIFFIPVLLLEEHIKTLKITDNIFLLIKVKNKKYYNDKYRNIIISNYNSSFIDKKFFIFFPKDFNLK